jgi:hypothetical protein
MIIEKIAQALFNSYSRVFHPKDRNTVRALMIMKDTGRITPWEDMGKGIFRKRTYGRAIDGGDGLVVVVRGREETGIAWDVSSAGDGPSRIFAAGSIRGGTFKDAMDKADASLKDIDFHVPATCIPVLSKDDLVLMQCFNLLDNGTVNTKVTFRDIW